MSGRRAQQKNHYGFYGEQEIRGLQGPKAMCLDHAKENGTPKCIQLISCQNGNYGMHQGQFIELSAAMGFLGKSNSDFIKQSMPFNYSNLIWVQVTSPRYGFNLFLNQDF
ncbi:hypothetical protein BT96DRAFT_1001494 [Gymnopus androsaceus JB14]|uniref:Uncharacterized protein n=1 Tax=Gymnopus androsaceus JB14 TaxID=1447944 RepID=A0A6A4H1Q3_9AGAR|nr:hypothetical protein BT96DRAFT_1001494 [Gymnopus androsaceus JB14]